MIITEKKIEALAEKVHDAWWEEKRRQGFHPPTECGVSDGMTFLKNCPQCHPDMYPYEELSDNIKEYDRATVRVVLEALLG